MAAAGLVPLSFQARDTGVDTNAGADSGRVHLVYVDTLASETPGHGESEQAGQRRHK